MVCSNFAIPNASAVTFLKANAIAVTEDYVNYKAAGDRLFWIYQCEKGNVCKIDIPLNYFRQHYNKVSPRKEFDGTQAKENYRINQYLHQRGYISGITRYHEYVYYWKYLQEFKFENKQIRTELIRLWFPEWWRCGFTFSIARSIINSYSYIIGNARRLKHWLFK